MIPLRSALSDYLSMRRSLGYKLQRTEKLLFQFIEYVEAKGADRGWLLRAVLPRRFVSGCRAADNLHVAFEDADLVAHHQ